MSGKLLVTAFLALGLYLLAFALLVVINGMMAAGLTDQEYARSGALAALTLGSKAVLAIVVGVAAGWRLPRWPATILAGVLMISIVILGHLLPGGGLVFSPFADDLISHQVIAVLFAAGVGWLVATAMSYRTINS